ncbi:hypothetical protein OG21DRAFT_1200025 [Imleria badia]|nr:hypothetical protein OG21DRAFT_1200025 [Imleria badia]
MFMHPHDQDPNMSPPRSPQIDPALSLYPPTAYSAPPTFRMSSPPTRRKKPRTDDSTDGPSPAAEPKPKSPRAARSCTVCRRVKLKCVGAEQGPPCKRCLSGNHDCIFETSNRGKRSSNPRKHELLTRSLRKMERTLDTVLRSIGEPSKTSRVLSRSPSPLVHTAQNEALKMERTLDAVLRSIGTPSMTSGMISHSLSPVAQTAQSQALFQSPSPPSPKNFPTQSAQSATLSSSSPDLPNLSPVPPLCADQLSAPDRPIAPSTLPHLPTTSPLAVEQQLEMSTIGAICPPPPDLTPYITKADDQYVAGGGFGDIYRCWYRDGSPKEVRVWQMTHLPLFTALQVAVKAFRFTFAIDGDVSDRSTKMLRRELGIWRRLDHINVVPFLGIAYGFGMRGTMSLVSLWMPNESLHRFLAKYDNNLSVGHRLQFLLDIAKGLHYCESVLSLPGLKKSHITVHSHPFPIVHGDLNCVRQSRILWHLVCLSR